MKMELRLEMQEERIDQNKPYKGEIEKALAGFDLGVIEKTKQKVIQRYESALSGEYFVARKLEDCHPLIPLVEENIRNYRESLEEFRNANFAEVVRRLNQSDYINGGWTPEICESLREKRRDLVERLTKCMPKPLSKVNGVLGSLVTALTYAEDMPFIHHTNTRIGNMASNQFKTSSGIADKKQLLLDTKDWKIFEAGVNRFIGYSAGFMVRDELLFEVFKNYLGMQKNPYECLAKIHEMGIYPIGFRTVRSGEKFYVDFPLKSHNLGCWREGEPKIIHRHSWFSQCDKRRIHISNKQSGGK